MSRPVQTRIRRARGEDLGAIGQLLNDAPARGVAALLNQGCVLLATRGNVAAGLAALDLDNGSIATLTVAQRSRGVGLGRQLVAASEQLAVSFGLLQLKVRAPGASRGFFTACGYTPLEAAPPGDEALLARRFVRRQTRYGARIAALQRELGIPLDYGRSRRLPLQAESPTLACIGPDLLGRNQHLAPRAAAAWGRMLKAACQDGVVLELVSAFRSVEYQAGIIRRKQQQGQPMDTILAVSAAPGFSEHHTGRALDLSTPGCTPLTTEFETSTAFRWLTARAGGFGFTLSYPRENGHGSAYEPWHWCFTKH